MSGELGAGALDWTAGAPRSRRFDDVYFSATDGLAEARAVFLDGCGLPQAWSGRERFVVGELGFGTGLNLLAVLELWRRTSERGARLNLFSVEAFALTRRDAARALSAWPELAELSAVLLDAWPDDRRGFHRIDFPTASATLDLWIGEAADGLRAWAGLADAWFLDGFAPARNPQMWTDELLGLVAARSAPGARAATFTVAGQVRRALAAAGFDVDKRPGFGRKRERLEAWRSEPTRPPSAHPSPRRIAVIGAGVAGAALARAFRAEGVATLVAEASAPGAGGSGNPAALVTPRLDAGFGPGAQLYAQAFARAAALYRREAAHAIIGEGGLQLEGEARDASRFDRIAAWPGFASGALSRLTAGETAGRLDERADSNAARGSLRFRDALVIEPQVLLEAWLDGAATIRATVASLMRAHGGWRLLDEGGRTLAQADAVVLAGGAASVALRPGLRLQPVRGQVNWTRSAAFCGEAAVWGGYAIALSGRGFMFGATHQRDDEGVELRPEDTAYNLALLARARPALASALRGDLAFSPDLGAPNLGAPDLGAPDPGALGVPGLDGRASLRAATPDYLPLAGAMAGDEGLYILGGLGGRGFTLAPLLAEHVAALVLGAPSPLPVQVCAAVDPARFKIDARA